MIDLWTELADGPRKIPNIDPTTRIEYLGMSPFD